MSYIVEQKIKGNIYLYRVESYWDKTKKQARQKRIYIGPKNKKQKKVNFNTANIIHKKFGNMFLLKDIAENLGLRKVLEATFQKSAADILNLACFFVCDERASYLYNHWQDENYGTGSHLYSAYLSSLYKELGENQQAVFDFFNKWISMCSPKSGVYFDITSLSSYSTQIDFVEWGYNRNRESLLQVNMGIICERQSQLPLYYQIYPGSISDVTTLENCLKRLEYFGVEDVLLIMDRGFCSKANIMRLNRLKGKFSFIQPLTFSMKLVKQLIKKHRRMVEKMENAFKFNEEVLYHHETPVDLEWQPFTVHMYYNEKAAIDQRHSFLARLIDTEKEIENKKFESVKDYLVYRNECIPNKFITFFKLNKKKMMIERNTKTISDYLMKAGYFLLLSNSLESNRDKILDDYRGRDIIEKMFDVEKNELHGNRLRGHTAYNTEGRFFVKFVALILHSHITKMMKESKLFERYTVRELLAELGKIRRINIDENIIISEISKAQRSIFKAFNINPGMVAKT